MIKSLSIIPVVLLFIALPINAHANKDELAEVCEVAGYFSATSSDFLRRIAMSRIKNAGLIDDPICISGMEAGKNFVKVYRDTGYPPNSQSLEILRRAYRMEGKVINFIVENADL